MTDPVKCKMCGSEEVETSWCEPPGLPECEVAVCTDCGHDWVRCAE
jgi:hypothetical protein